MCVSIIRLDILGIDEKVIGIKHFVGDFACNAAWHVRGVKSLDDINAANAVEAGLEEIFMTYSTSVHHAESSNNYSGLFSEQLSYRCP